MKRLRSQNGSILILVMVVAVVFAIIVMDLSSRFVSLSKDAHRFGVSSETMRVGDEMSKIVAHAYEYGVQVVAQGIACPGIIQAVGSVSLCFAPNDLNYGNCVATKFNSTGRVCLDIPASTLISKNNQFYDHNVDQRIENQSPFNSNFLKLFIPDANASNSQSAMPPNPVGPMNAATGYTCTGGGADPAICRKCGAGSPANFCYQVAFCPVDKAVCTPAEEIKIDMMIAR